MNALLAATRRAACCLALTGLSSGCKPKAAGAGAAGGASLTASASAAAAPSNAAPGVDHGELDTQAPSDSPKIAATVIATTVYKLPDTASRRLGYLRLGGIVDRDAEPTRGKGCKGQWFHIFPMGYVCSDEATTDLATPLVRAASRRPEIDKAMPYRYGFVRATSPQYLRIPTHQEQLKSEFKLDEHLAWFEQNRKEVQQVVLGANDVPLDARGVALPGFAALEQRDREGRLLSPQPGFKASPELSEIELFGGQTASDPLPFWLEGGRKIPNVSGYAVPEYAYFADRVRRKTGLSFVAAFDTVDEAVHRPFAVTVDLRLLPISKLKPDSASPFHGLDITDKMPLPFAWVNKTGVTTYKLIKGRDEVRAAEAIPRRALVPLSGNARMKAGGRFYQTARDKTVWLRADDIGVVDKPGTWPEFAEKGEKWIDVSITEQVLVLYEGKKPVYATLVSTGRDKLGDPKETLSTLRGTFRLQSKHIAAAMDSEENSSVSGGSRGHATKLSTNAAETSERLKKAEASSASLSAEDKRRLANINKGRDPEYGITMRRGSSDFELRDVPWIQYFAAGFALHGAYWHDVFGIARSHGCINLAPIDARYVFQWTDPPVPKGWHGINVGADMGQGTGVVVRE